MLANGKLCGDAQKLAAYLIKGHPDKRAELVEVRGFVSRGTSADIAEYQENSLRAVPFHLPNGFESSNLATAFQDLATRARQTGVEAPFFHCHTRLAAGEFLLPNHWAAVADREEKCLGFSGQPRAVALPLLGPFGTHAHRMEPDCLQRRRTSLRDRPRPRQEQAEENLPPARIGAWSNRNTGV
jgi:hypothetical protein